MTNETANEQTRPRGLWPRRVSWPTIVFALLALASLIAISQPGLRYPTPMPMRTGGVMMEDSASIGKESYYPYPYQNPEIPVTDTREFLKTYYSATLSTRDVQGLTRRVETTVRGYGGRIDQESSSPQYGSVSFSIPQSKYDAFRAELESLVGGRFLVTNISSQNLLPQKVSIEEQQKQADAALTEYRAARQRIVSAHASAVQSIQTKINSDEAELAVLRTQPQTQETAARIQAVTNDWSYQKQRLANEDAAYSTQLSNADRDIKTALDRQISVRTQDQALLDEVATVSGTVSIQWISLWDMAQRYLPGYWIPSIFSALAFLSLLWDRRRFGTV